MHLFLNTTSKSKMLAFLKYYFEKDFQNNDDTFCITTDFQPLFLFIDGYCWKANILKQIVTRCMS